MGINQKIIFLVEICNIIINKQENEEIKVVIVKGIKIWYINRKGGSLYYEKDRSV